MNLENALICAFGLIFSMFISICLYHSAQIEILHCGMKARVACCSIIYRKVYYSVPHVYNIESDVEHIQKLSILNLNITMIILLQLFNIKLHCLKYYYYHYYQTFKYKLSILIFQNCKISAGKNINKIVCPLTKHLIVIIIKKKFQKCL